MIRYIKIGDQINEDENEFAFYDTIIERFYEFCGVQVWDSLAEFTMDFDSSAASHNDKLKERLIGLYEANNLKN